MSLYGVQKYHKHSCERDFFSQNRSIWVSKRPEFYTGIKSEGKFKKKCGEKKTIPGKLFFQKSQVPSRNGWNIPEIWNQQKFGKPYKKRCKHHYLKSIYYKYKRKPSYTVLCRIYCLLLKKCRGETFILLIEIIITLIRFLSDTSPACCKLCRSLGRLPLSRLFLMGGRGTKNF